MKIVINTCYGGFAISKEAAQFMAEQGSQLAQQELKETQTGNWYGYGYIKDNYDGYQRTDPFLIKAVETLGKKANTKLSKLKIVEIPDDTEYYIEDYDGLESVHEQHKIWE